MRHLIPLLLLLPLNLRAQLQNWNPEPYRTDSTMVFRDDLDYFLNGYSEADIKQMRKQVNIWRMNWDRMMKTTMADLRAYSEGYGMSAAVHDLDLPVVGSGTHYRSKERTGRIRAYMFVSLSNPPARMQLPRWERLRAKYDTAQVDLFVIYGRELHPGDKKSYSAYPLPTTQEAKAAYAKELAGTTTLPVLLDGLQEEVYSAHGRAPNGAYIVDADGHPVFRGTWADSRKVEHILDELLKWYAAGRPPAE